MYGKYTCTSIHRNKHVQYYIWMNIECPFLTQKEDEPAAKKKKVEGSTEIGMNYFYRASLASEIFFLIWCLKMFPTFLFT